MNPHLRGPSLARPKRLTCTSLRFSPKHLRVVVVSATVSHFSNNPFTLSGRDFHTYLTDKEAEPLHSSTETLAFRKEAL